MHSVGCGGIPVQSAGTGLCCKQLEVRALEKGVKIGRGSRVHCGPFQPEPLSNSVASQVFRRPLWIVWQNMEQYLKHGAISETVFLFLGFVSNTSKTFLGEGAKKMKEVEVQ